MNALTRLLRRSHGRSVEEELQALLAAERIHIAAWQLRQELRSLGVQRQIEPPSGTGLDEDVTGP